MKYLALLLIFGFGISGFGQTIKSLGFNTTNGQVIADTGTNRLIITNVVQFNPANVTFKSSDGVYNSGKVLWVEPLSDTVVKGYDFDSGANPIKFFGGVTAGGYGIPGPSLTPSGLGYSTDIVIGKILGTNFNWEYAPTFTNTAQETRANLGFSTNINALWTATNASNARSSINLGASWLTNTNATNFRADIGFSTNLTSLWTATNASNARSAVGLSASWLTNTNVTNYRTAIGLGWAALTNTNAASRLIGLIPSTNIATTTYNNVVVAQGGANNLTVTNRGVNFINGQIPIITLRDEPATFYGTNWTNYDVTSYGATLTGDYILVGEINPFLGVSGSCELLSYGAMRVTTVTNTNTTNTVELSPDGLTFSKANAISATRTNLGLGGGVTTNITFVSQSTNTNTVTISNGIITSWTQ